MMPAFDPHVDPVIVAIPVVDRQSKNSIVRSAKVQAFAGMSYRRAIMFTSVVLTIVIACIVSSHLSYVANITQLLKSEIATRAAVEVQLIASQDEAKASRERLQSFVEMIHTMHAPPSLPV